MTTVTTSELLARALDPSDPEGSLLQEVGDAGVEHMTQILREWLEEGEKEPPGLVSDITVLVERIINPSVRGPERPFERGMLSQNLARAIDRSEFSSVAAVSRASGVHRNAIARAMSTETSPSVDTLDAIARCLGCSVASLLDTTGVWDIVLDEDFAATPAGNGTYVIIDPVEFTVRGYVSLTDNSQPESVFHRLKVMVRVPRGALGGKTRRALETNAHLLDALAARWEGVRSKGGQEIGMWQEDYYQAIEDLAHVLSRVERLWDASDWLEWECASSRDGAASAIATAILDASDWSKGVDAYLEEFRSKEGSILTDDVVRQVRALFERVRDELTDELEEAREDEDTPRVSELSKRVDMLTSALAL